MIEPLNPTQPQPTALEALGEEIALLSAQIQAATYRLLVMIREFDEHHGWYCGLGESGFRSCAHWLNWRTGLDMGAAREKVRVARALGELPKISESMRCGELSYSKARALTRVATADNETELLDFAKAGTAAHVEQLVRAWRRVDRYEEAQLDSRRRASRSLQYYTDEDGMLVLRARLEPEVGAAVLLALEAAGEVLYRKQKERATATEEVSDPEPEISAEQRRADAISLIAEAALAHGLDTSPRGERLQVVVHIDSQVLEDPDQPGISMLDDGQNVSAETSRRLACDCAKVEMRHDSDGNILDVGRRTRTISTPLRRALAHRDRTCQFPACDVTYCEAHHVKHWANGGTTNLDNLVLLCRRHHRAIHEGGFSAQRTSDGRFRFFTPGGAELVPAPASPLASPLVSLLATPLDSATALPSWAGGSFDLAWAVEGYRRLGQGTKRT